jgi:glycosyltransferase involved in cell wall biosynthesis
MVRVALDARILSLQAQLAGVGQYIRGLLEGYRQAPSEIEYVPLSVAAWTSEQYPVPATVIAPRRPLPWQSVVMPWALRQFRCQVFHGPAFAVPATLRLPKVVTVHDLAFWRVPDTVPERTRTYLKRAVGQSLRVAAAIIVPSSEVKQDLLAYYPWLRAQAKRIHVIALGADRLLAAGQTAPEPQAYAVHVGTVEPRKNFIGLMAAWDLFRQKSSNPGRLVLIGGAGWKHDGWWQDLLARPDVLYRGYVDDRLLARYLAHAQFVVSASLYEGFGLPVVEALALGTKAVATPTGVARDLVHPNLFVAADFSPDALCEAMWRAVTTPLADRKVPLMRWADVFTRHAEVYREVSQ